jgi:hypothetical protein
MTQLTVQLTFDLALRHHQAGRLKEAEQLGEFNLEARRRASK